MTISGFFSKFFKSVSVLSVRLLENWDRMPKKSPSNKRMFIGSCATSQVLICDESEAGSEFFENFRTIGNLAVKNEGRDALQRGIHDREVRK